MIIEKNYSRFIVFHEDSILTALNKIGDNKSRMIFVVTESGHLEGVVSDGDVRRWLTSANEINLSDPISKIANRDFVSAPEGTTISDLQSMFSPAITMIPLVSEQERLVGIAISSTKSVRFGDLEVGPENPSFLIAEIGNNHNGSLDAALELIDLAANAGANCAKFQMRDMKALYREKGQANNASEDLGAQYTLDLLSRFQLSDEEMFLAFDRCAEKGLIPLCTPWDLSSLEKLEKYGISGYKVASADFTNYELIDAIAETCKPMICSTGMSTEFEIRSSIEHLNDLGCPYVLLHCNSTYPTPDKDINLKYMNRLKELGNGLVGYSGHERGYSVPIAAVALGANIVEKHFTTDRNLEGNDHKVSLLPDEFAQMVRGIRQVETAMLGGAERSVSQGEMMNREILAKSLIANVDIPAGTTVTEDMIEIRSPGQGLQPNRKAELVGRSLSVAKSAGEFFFESDLQEQSELGGTFNFPQKWGIPVRYHDFDKLSQMANMDLVEIHLSYKDLEVNYKDYLDGLSPLELVVHAPELFAGDHTLDLCSSDESYLARSIEEMQRVIDLTRELKAYFSGPEKTPIVTNVGGFTTGAHLPADKRTALYEKVYDSITKLDTDGVEIIPQTMPPFPWHFGGQQFHNLFVYPDEIVAFCEKYNMNICLDVSHSKLSCTFAKTSFDDFMKKVAKFSRHYHLADAKGLDGEGLQINDGEINWERVLQRIDEFSPNATFIPEIWQGHKNNGEGAWTALRRLQNAKDK